MGWIHRTPSQARIDFWRGLTQGGHKVAKWPHPNTPRINPRFRLSRTHFRVLPVASRWGFWYKPIVPGWDPDDPDNYAFGWFDMEVRDIDHIGLTAPENEWGYAMEVDVKSTDDLRLFPGVGGIEATIDLIHADGTLKQFGNWIDAGNFQSWEYDIDTKEKAATPGWTLETPTPPGMDLKIIEMFAVSECYLFPEEDVGQAEFNGIDAYIALDHDITKLNNAFVIDVDVKLKSPQDFWPVFGRDNDGGFIGMEGPSFIFGFLKVFTAFVPVADQWYNWRVEFEQPDLLKIKLFIDDVEMSSDIINRLNTPFNVLGVWRRTQPNELWAHLDMKNLKVLTGAFPSTDVELDMPLIENALDSGPELNHGTTFNMDLPDV